MEIIRDIKDPEYPISLEERGVIKEDAVEVDNNQNNVDVRVAPGSHKTEAEVNENLNTKECVAAALEDPALIDMLDKCLV
ncbi:hypothetical protein OROHE_020511 [Orobanche hederae]